MCYLNLGYNIILSNYSHFVVLCKTHHSINKTHVSYNNCTLYEFLYSYKV
jgi:hypothetical protein